MAVHHACLLFHWEFAVAICHVAVINWFRIIAWKDWESGYCTLPLLRRILLYKWVPMTMFNTGVLHVLACKLGHRRGQITVQLFDICPACNFSQYIKTGSKLSASKYCGKEIL